jgi:hypothetical protein
VVITARVSGRSGECRDIKVPTLGPEYNEDSQKEECGSIHGSTRLSCGRGSSHVDQGRAKGSLKICVRHSFKSDPNAVQRAVSLLLQFSNEARGRSALNSDVGIQDDQESAQACV